MRSVSVLVFLLLFGLCLAPTRGQEESLPELVTEADLKLLRTSAPQYFKALGASSLNQTDANLIREFMRLQVLQMSMKSNERLLPDIREKLKREIDLRAKPPARDVMLQEIVKNCKLLLKYPLPIRLNAVMLITELNETSGDLAKGIPPAPYQGMTEALLDVIGDPNQHEALKVAAVNGLLRICRDSNPRVDIRLKMAEMLVKELESTTTSEWYRMVAIQTLARTDVLNDAQRRPFVVQKLAEILVDTKQGWRVRADAAYALARVPMDTTINVPLLLHEIARFAHDMSLQYNNTKDAAHWRYCMVRLYLVFRPEDARDTALLDRITRNPLNKFRTEVQGLYDVVLPVINDVIEFVPQQAISAANSTKLKSWIDGNPPANLSVSLDPNVKVKPLRNAG
ncbi:MAG: hypothetical protein KDA76_12495 [Planctomycetaceae bacterium]|nr:hypothetical protein [Planctomycetaceae bacterium]